jgi:hypothetical protein
MLSCEGIGCVIRECREDVLLGMIKLLSPWSRVTGRASRSLVRGRVKDDRVVREGAILGGRRRTQSVCRFASSKLFEEGLIMWTGAARKFAVPKLATKVKKAIK